jgi:diaminohydroxyphosphoribosylaminopyrimidine deaminase / 5-amino-6-(5-phosphoribosylamino)uracil reductase
MSNRKDISPSDERFMLRAMELAKLGMGQVSPNPLVGCVIVHDEKIIGEGWHKQYGQPHAEVNAIDSVADKSLLPHSILYVNLEPCSHFGKTPPCADLIIKHRIKKVVIANADPNPLVNGNGLQKLREAGIETIVGVLEKGGRELNKRFFTAVEKNRPYVILKWAQSADGFIAHKNFDSKWISHDSSRQLVHKWRSENDAILVGTRTAQHDNPELTVRDWNGKSPVRIVFDRFLRLSEKLKLFDGTQPTRCYNVMKHEEHANLALIRVSENNFVPDVLHNLMKQKIQSVIVEGGAQTLSLFLNAGLWDEARVFTSAKPFNEGIAAPLVNMSTVSSRQSTVIHSMTLTDHLDIYYRKH